MDIKIEKVINPSKEVLDITTKWMFNWWGKGTYTLDDVYSYMEHSFNDDGFPQTYIMYLDNTVIGIYQITYRDLFIRPDIYPWIANLYIDEKYRKKGYGKLLIESIKENARKNTPFDKLYLYTEYKNLYEKYGWEYIGELNNSGKYLYELYLKD